jgi:hypothetical protein
MNQNDEAKFLHSILRGNAQAVQFCQSLFEVSQTLDDLIDGDSKITQQVVISAFWKTLIEIPANPFYREHEPYLRPLMAMALQDWRDSVVLERSDSEHNKTLAFVLRDQLSGVVTQCAYLLGGESWMASVGPQVRQYFHDEPLSDYLKEFEAPGDTQTPE